MYILGCQQNAWTPGHNLSNDTNVALLEYGLSFALPVRVKHCREKKKINQYFKSGFPFFSDIHLILILS